VLIAIMLAGCAPFAGTAPALQQGPVAPAAVARTTRLQGIATVNDTLLANAKLTAIDLASGKPLTLIAAGGQNLIAAGGQNYALRKAADPGTDDTGRFDYELQGLAPGQVVKLVASAGGRTLVALFDGQGNAVGAYGEPSKAYSLAQDRRDRIDSERAQWDVDRLCRDVGGCAAATAGAAQQAFKAGMKAARARGYDGPGAEPAWVQSLFGYAEAAAVVAGERACGAGCSEDVRQQAVTAAQLATRGWIEARLKELVERCYGADVSVFWEAHPALRDTASKAASRAVPAVAATPTPAPTPAPLVVQLKLTLASTAAAKTFEGTLKLQFQRPDTQDGITKVIGAANMTVKILEQAIAKRPELAARIADIVGANGEIAQTAAFTEVIASLGVLDEVATFVKDTLKTLGAAAQTTVTGTLDRVTAEDFPVGQVTLTEDGTFSYTDTQGQTVTGALVTGGFLPTGEAPTATPTPAGGSEPAPAPVTTGGRRSTPASPTASGNIQYAPGRPTEPLNPEALATPGQ
jgi:hypothetical protein